MDSTIFYSSQLNNNNSIVLLINNIDELDSFSFSKEEKSYIEKEVKKEIKSICINRFDQYVFVEFLEQGKEKARLRANTLHSSIVSLKIDAVDILDLNKKDSLGFYFAEGLALSNYQFLKYFSKDKSNSLKKINLISDNEDKVKNLQAMVEGTLIARDLVNEPLSYLTALQYSKDMEALSKEVGLKVEVLHKKKIETLKMGGLLAVNKGSIDPPTFTIMEWNPKNPTNKKPIVLVGKGIVYDTGGLSLKPTANSMDIMKCDMGGSAAVVGAMYAIAKAKLDVHVIALIPATDNRPSGNAYAPGDVITMFDGTTVEVLNTDAEGRLILADALSYAKKYKPELVIDLATLTGAAARAIGKQGIVAMGNDQETMEKLKQSGNEVHERIAEFPFWSEYSADLKSTIADLKNLGGPEGGAITAGKFLEHFTDYPYTHLDIAGPAFCMSPFNYRGVGGTGVGVRILFDFLKNKSE
ncbi:leucyl aminopeptidase [Flavobacteriales bacterium]|nr:leucyl aminopeptidase [Flavobacteriales bacterium]